MEESTPLVKCRCGFTATGPSQSENLDAYEKHDCPQTGWEWFVDHLFSWYGLLLTFIIAGTLAQIFGHANFF